MSKDSFVNEKVSRREFLKQVGRGGVMLAGLELLHPQSATATSKVNRGGTLKYPWGNLNYISDPCKDGIGTGQMARNVAETLIQLDPDGNPQPLLCKSWEPRKGTKEWILHLQEGVTFNNGKPFNADDVVWNFRHWLDPEVGSPNREKLSMLSPSGVEKVDNYTVKLSLDRPFYGIPYSLHGYAALIAPEGGWEDFYSGDPKDAIGTGPFKMEKYIPNETMKLVRREDYWRDGVDGNPLPYLDRVEVVPGLEATVVVASVLQGKLDISGTSQPELLKKLERSPEVNAKTLDVGWSTPARVRCDKEPFDDPRVRQAMKWAQDREKLRDLIMPDGPLGWDHQVQSFRKSYCSKTDGNRPQKIEKAKKLLAEAGYPNGFETKLYNPGTSNRSALSQALGQMLAKVNIDVSIQNLPSSAFWDKWKEWPFSVSGWSARPLAIDNMRLGCTCDAGWNEMHWCNKEFDATMEKYLATVDVDKRRQLSCKLQKIMQDDSGLLLPYWVPYRRAWRKEIHWTPNIWNYYFTETWKE